jgi:hypothetical protein
MLAPHEPTSARPSAVSGRLTDALPRRGRDRPAAGGRRLPSPRRSRCLGARTRRVRLHDARRRQHRRLPARHQARGRIGLPHHRRPHRLPQPACEAGGRHKQRRLSPTRRGALRRCAAVHMAGSRPVAGRSRSAGARRRRTHGARGFRPTAAAYPEPGHPPEPQPARRRAEAESPAARHTDARTGEHTATARAARRRAAALGPAGGPGACRRLRSDDRRLPAGRHRRVARRVPDVGTPGQPGQLPRRGVRPERSRRSRQR